MIYDKDFLLKLDKEKNKIIYAKITSLTFDEQPLETIEGRVTQGSINVDGTSAVRRTCSLTMVAKDFDQKNYYWGINTKFKLEIGVENHVDFHYPDLIWFNQGIYVFTTFNSSKTTSGFTISLQGKDKMCLLNGEIGGSLESSVDFGVIEEENSDGVWTIKPIPLKDIIRNAVHTYAGEPYHNIIINDLEDYGIELLEYRYDIPMYLYRVAGTKELSDKEESFIFDNILLNGNQPCSVIRYNSENDEDERVQITLKELLPNELEMLVDSLTGSSNPSPVRIDNEDYYVAKIEYGQTAGYRVTDLTYAGDLIANVGESITAVLDKIKNMLSEFEYFYDVDGQFVFQRKQSFVNTLWSPTVDAETEEYDENGNNILHTKKYVESLINASAWSYVFSEAELITAFNNNPNLSNVKNDFSIWGNRRGISGADIPVHLRYAIDLKPEFYKTIDGRMFMTNKEIYEKLKLDAKDSILVSIKERIENFQLQYEIPNILTPPLKQEDGSWSAGWWDIRDWHDYYYALTLEEPRFTMKWYSRNDETGCIPCNTIPGYEESEQWTWMIVATTRADGSVSFSFGHGSGGAPTPESAHESIKRESFYGPDKELITQIAQPEERRDILSPYWGCSDTHTYLYFLENVISDTSKTYFYNPNFPDQISFDKLVQNQIDKEFNEYLESGMLNFVDWREIIYQMAKDYYKHNTLDDFELLVKKNNLDFYPTGKTGYERYYIDLEGFWRQIYNPFFEHDIKKYTEKVKKGTEQDLPLLEHCLTLTKNKDIEEFYDSLTEFNDYFFIYFNDEKKFVGILNSFHKTVKSFIDTLKTNIETWTKKLEDLTEEQTKFYLAGEKHSFWAKDVYEAPQNLNFWFDFLDTEGDLLQFNVKHIGARSKAVNETTIKSIYFRETPDIIFKSPGEFETLSGYKYIQVQDIENMFSISAQGKSAKDRLDELIYNHGYSVETATITTIPIYYLQPNTRVYVSNTETNLSGEYIVSKMTIPLSYNGTMSITATKAAESIR